MKTLPAVAVEYRPCATGAEVMAEYMRLRRAGYTRAQAALVIEDYIRRGGASRRAEGEAVDRKSAAAGHDGE